MLVISILFLSPIRFSMPLISMLFLSPIHFITLVLSILVSHIDVTVSRSPTMAGCIFTIEKDFFKELGFYDPAFRLYGAENLEISFKVRTNKSSL